MMASKDWQKNFFETSIDDKEKNSKILFVKKKDPENGKFIWKVISVDDLNGGEPKFYDLGPYKFTINALLEFENRYSFTNHSQKLKDIKKNWDDKKRENIIKDICEWGRIKRVEGRGFKSLDIVRAAIIFEKIEEVIQKKEKGSLNLDKELTALKELKLSDVWPGQCDNSKMFYGMGMSLFSKILRIVSPENFMVFDSVYEDKFDKNKYADIETIFMDVWGEIKDDNAVKAKIATFGEFESCIYYMIKFCNFEIGYEGEVRKE